jgi:kelch-like protein 8
MTAVTVGHKIYVIGGYDASYTYLTTVEAFDVQLGTWETVAPMNVPRGDVHAVAIDDSILVAAGYTNGVTLARTLEQYFPNRNTWIVRDDIPVPRGYF